MAGKKEVNAMANINVVNLGGEKVGEFELHADVFTGEINDGLLWEAVTHYRAALRQGTASTKTRKNVSGSGKKLWKQKGTGRARIGSIRSPLWRSGGTVHGPVPRSYDYQFPKKKLFGALRSAVAAEDCRGQAHHRRFLRRSRGQDQALPRVRSTSSKQARRRCWSSPARSSTRTSTSDRAIWPVSSLFSARKSIPTTCSATSTPFSPVTPLRLSRPPSRKTRRSGSTLPRRRLRNANPLHHHSPARSSPKRA